MTFSVIICLFSVSICFIPSYSLVFTWRTSINNLYKDTKVRLDIKKQGFLTKLTPPLLYYRRDNLHYDVWLIVLDNLQMYVHVIIQLTPLLYQLFIDVRKAKARFMFRGRGLQYVIYISHVHI
jgi:hypothetical protein